MITNTGTDPLTNITGQPWSDENDCAGSVTATAEREEVTDYE